jgi:hypothetical protein
MALFDISKYKKNSLNPDRRRRFLTVGSPPKV